MADVIDYKIYGDDMQIVEVELDPGEGVRAEAGAMMFMDEGIEVQDSSAVRDSFSNALKGMVWHLSMQVGQLSKGNFMQVSLSAWTQDVLWPSPHQWSMIFNSWEGLRMPYLGVREYFLLN